MDSRKEPLRPLFVGARELFKQKLDLATLALRQEVDAYARAHNEYEISLQNINRAWLVLFKMKEVVEEPANAWVTFRASKLTPHSLVCGYVDLNTELVGPPPDFTDCIKSALRRDEVRPVQTVARASRSGIHFCQ
jgi:hypothetical protein